MEGKTKQGSRRASKMPERPKHPGVHLSISWGYDVTVDLLVSERNWSKICNGKPVTIRGKGYYYEGEF